MKKRKPFPKAMAFDTIKAAASYADKLKAKQPGRYFSVVHHPKERGKFAVGIMAGGVLLCGYAPQFGAST